MDDHTRPHDENDERENTNNGKGSTALRALWYCRSRDKIGFNAVRIFDDKWQQFLPRYLRARFHYAMSFVTLSHSSRHRSFFSLSFSLSFSHSLVPSPSRFSLSLPPLSALHVDSSLDSRQHALLFFILRRTTSGYSLYPTFSVHLRYGASINNGAGYNVAAVSTRVVLFVRSLLLCCSHHQRKTSFDPGSTVSYGRRLLGRKYNAWIFSSRTVLILW